MPIVLQNSTLSGNTATAEDKANLLSFTKVMLKTDQDPGSDSFVFEDSPSGELAFEPQGRLLLGSEQGVFSDDGFDGDGKDGLATYNTADTDLPLSTVEREGIPVSLAEYGLLL